MFLVPVALAVVAGFRRWVVAAVFAAQAVLSEVVQTVFLPHRSGDVLDAVADLTGVALGVVVGGSCCACWPAGNRRPGDPWPGSRHPAVVGGTPRRW